MGDATAAVRLTDRVKALVKAGLRASGVEIPQLFAGVRLSLSQRRFVRLGYAPLDGYDAVHHFGDRVLDPSFQYVLEGFMIARLRYIRAQLDKPEIQRSSFADIGDSNGVFLKALGKPGTSINLSQDVLHNIPGLATLQGALPNLPVPDRAFDYVLCFETVEHLHDPIGGLRELARVARKGVFVSIPFVSPTRVHPYWPDRSVPAAEQHVIECSDEDFRTLLTYTDLQVSAMAVHHVFDPPRTPRELAVALMCRARGKDVLCGVFKRFSVYFLQHGEEGGQAV